MLTLFQLIRSNTLKDNNNYNTTKDKIKDDKKGNVVARFQYRSKKDKIKDLYDTSLKKSGHKEYKIRSLYNTGKAFTSHAVALCEVGAFKAAVTGTDFSKRHGFVAVTVTGPRPAIAEDHLPFKAVGEDLTEAEWAFTRNKGPAFFIVEGDLVKKDCWWDWETGEEFGPLDTSVIRNAVVGVLL